VPGHAIRLAAERKRSTDWREEGVTVGRGF
jgi:hypothetical protein